MPSDYPQPSGGNARSLGGALASFRPVTLLCYGHRYPFSQSAITAIYDDLNPLLVIGAIGYVGPTGLNIWRLILGCGINRFLDIDKHLGFSLCCAVVYWVMAGTFWVVTTQWSIHHRHTRMVNTGIPHPLVTLGNEMPIYKGANGNWFILVVGAQSVAVLAAQGTQTYWRTAGSGRRRY